MNVLIIDGAHTSAGKLTQLINEIDPEIEIIGQLDSIEASVRWLNEHPMPDLIFTDVALSDGCCFEVFEKIKVEKPVIFTATSSDYALQAFKVNAIDYLLKPLKKADLEQAFEKYRKLIEPSKNAASQPDHSSPRFLIRFGQNFRLVELRVAAYIYTENKITFIVTKEGRRYPVQHSLEKLEEMADPQSFFRINRQFIVNIDSIREMHTYTKSRVKLLLDPPTAKETIVSSVRSPQFKRWLLEAEVA